MNNRKNSTSAVHRRIAAAVAVAALGLTAYGCGSSDPSVSGRAREAGDARVRTAQAAGGLQTVTYGGLRFDVPDDWTVYDLAADPAMCVRFDVHAVYLGDPSPDMVCPVGRVGSTEAVLVQVRAADADALPAPLTTLDAHGIVATVSDQRAAMGQIQADIGALRASITTGPDGDTAGVVQQILQSFRGADQ